MASINAWLREYRNLAEDQDKRGVDTIGKAESDSWPKVTRIDITSNVGSIALDDATRIYRISNNSGSDLHFKLGSTAADAGDEALPSGQSFSEGCNGESGLTLRFYQA